MPANRRNFWILLSVLSVIVTSARWMDDNQSSCSMMCEAPSAVCETTPRFAGSYDIDRAPVVTNLEQVKRRILRSYSCSARRQGVTGSVTARVLVDERGNYLRHRILSTSRCGLKYRCEPYLSLMRFQPAIKGNKAVKAWTNVRIDLGY